LDHKDIPHVNTINSQHTLRRTLKPRAGGLPGVPLVIVAAVAGVLLIGGGIGYAVETGHKQVSTSAPVGLAAIVPSLSSFTGVSPITHFGPAKKHGKHSATPAPLASPSVSPTPGTSPSPTPSVSPLNGKKVAQKLAAHHSKQPAPETLAFDPASATQAAVSNPVPTTEPVAPAPVTPQPATAAPQATPAYEAAVVVDARFITQVQPVYPEMARSQGIQGTAIVLVTVGANGRAISQSIGQSAGNRLLDAAALDAARASRFQAPEVDGHAETRTYRIVYTFAI
jgi:protein TonB